ncbi:AAA family ATPase [Nocardioides limicola]|uniref:AAA family ATPase n=1 Tax=Nocardioides limicola TaxID=2803368 RepID=UPI00193C13B4|nr:hypothetical protein [Nocardioides sp. DJM-14]
MPDLTCVLVVAAGAPWEPLALDHLSRSPDVVVLKRCVDVDDLLATAAAGQAHVALVALEATGLDQDAVGQLLGHRVRPVAITAATGMEEARGRARRIGVRTLVADTDIAGLADVLTATEPDTVPRLHRDLPAGEFRVTRPEPPDPAAATGPGRVIAVWGPAGAPGRSTVAAGIAAEQASRGIRTVLVDADPYGGALAQQLGVLDEASGLLSAVRYWTSGELRDRFAHVQRGLNEHLTLVSGLPRADRWAEVRPGLVTDLVARARAEAHVVLDTGFSLEIDPLDSGGRPARNTMTLDALAAADEIVVVGSCEPVGMARLGRAMVELRALELPGSVRVVINRMRPTLAWGAREIGDLVGVPDDRLHLLPDDRAGIDRALVAGRTLVEAGDGTLRRALAALVEQWQLTPQPGRRRLRTRTAAAGRPR